MHHAQEPETPESSPDEDVPVAAEQDIVVVADEDEDDCAACSNISDAQAEALADHDNGGKTIVCDPTCLEVGGDPSHCNYFGLGQICRGCGDCSDCTPCP